MNLSWQAAVMPCGKWEKVPGDEGAVRAGMVVHAQSEQAGSIAPGRIQLADLTSKHFAPLPAKSCFSQYSPASPRSHVLGHFVHPLARC